MIETLQAHAVYRSCHDRVVSPSCCRGCFCCCDSLRFICKGALSYYGIQPAMVVDTSTASRLSTAWVGTAQVGNTTSNYSAVKVSMSTGFGVNDTYIVSTVTLQNLLPTPLYNVSWMRSINPNQEEVRLHALLWRPAALMSYNHCRYTLTVVACLAISAGVVWRLRNRRLRQVPAPPGW